MAYVQSGAYPHSTMHGMRHEQQILSTSRRGKYAPSLRLVRGKRRQRVVLAKTPHRAFRIIECNQRGKANEFSETSSSHAMVEARIGDAAIAR